MQALQLPRRGRVLGRQTYWVHRVCPFLPLVSQSCADAGRSRRLRGAVQVAEAAAQEASPQSADEQEGTVTIDNKSNKTHTVVHVTARNGPGLLTGMTSVFRDMDLEVARAEVDTSNGAIRDVFHIVDMSGAKVTSKATLERLKAALVNVVQDSKHVAGRPNFAPGGKSTNATAMMGALPR
jgi:hypothetical protein